MFAKQQCQEIILCSLNKMRLSSALIWGHGQGVCVCVWGGGGGPEGGRGGTRPISIIWDVMKEYVKRVLF